MITSLLISKGASTSDAGTFILNDIFILVRYYSEDIIVEIKHVNGCVITIEGKEEGPITETLKQIL